RRTVRHTAGGIVKTGASTVSGIRPIGTIGSENRTRTSAACSRLPISPVGCAATTDTALDGCDAVCAVAADATEKIAHGTIVKSRITGLRIIASWDVSVARAAP